MGVPAFGAQAVGPVLGAVSTRPRVNTSDIRETRASSNAAWGALPVPGEGSAGRFPSGAVSSHRPGDSGGGIRAEVQGPVSAGGGLCAPRPRCRGMETGQVGPRGCQHRQASSSREGGCVGAQRGLSAPAPGFGWDRKRKETAQGWFRPATVAETGAHLPSSKNWFVSHATLRVKGLKRTKRSVTFSLDVPLRTCV